MQKKRIPKASIRRLLFFGTLSIGVIIYFVFSVAYYAMNIYRLQKEEKVLLNSLSALQADEKNLKTEIDKLKDPEYLARYARENYLYSKDGEIVIKLQKENIIINPQSEEKDYSYILFGGFLILALIVIYVMKKSRRKVIKD